MVVASSFLWDYHRIQCRKDFVVELGNVHSAPIQAPQALVFLAREPHDIVATVAGHNDHFTVRNSPVGDRIRTEIR